MIIIQLNNFLIYKYLKIEGCLYSSRPAELNQQFKVSKTDVSSLNKKVKSSIIYYFD